MKDQHRTEKTDSIPLNNFPGQSGQVKVGEDSAEDPDDEFLVRARNLYGKNLDSLRNAKVILAGVGGVGSFALQGLARSGVGHIMIIDKDTIEPSNLNRQLVARRDTVGMDKVEVAKKDVALINPECEVIAVKEFYDKEMNDRLKAFEPDYIIDCIDSVDSKKDLIFFALENQIPILASMGMARKTDPSQIEITELEKTSYDPLAKILRIWKRKNRIKEKIYVASSREKPQEFVQGQQLPSSIFVPGTAGLMLAGRCVQDLLEQKGKAGN